ncbi:MAG: hypothetical protein M3115_06480 [Thermoproteota archaeon]|nr:hypothetical protein [Thermoproteota archaeon]
MSSITVAWPSSVADIPLKVYASGQIPPQQGVANENAENMTASTISNFHAEGTINLLTPFSPSSIEDEEMRLFLLGGNWVLSVNQGTVEDFVAEIVMVQENGNLLHTHTIYNLTNVTSSISPIGSEQHISGFENISLSNGIMNHTITFSGFADIATNGVTQWEDVAVTITILNGNVISMIPNPGQIDHFYALPIYGIVRTLIDKSGESLREQQIANNATLAFHGKGAVDFDYEETGADVDAGDNVAASDASSPGTIANDSAVDTTGTGTNDEQRVEEEGTLTEEELPDNVRGYPVPDELSEEFPHLNSTVSQAPIVEEMSDNQNYLVQLRWTPYDILLPQNGISYTIYFLDGQQPRSTEDIVPPWVSNYSGFSRANPSLYVDPQMLNFEAVESYDMTIYSDTGNILWQKDDLGVYGGRDWGMITFAEPYEGPITVVISDIKPSEGIFGGDDDNNDRPAPDSVTFTSLVIE